jgi:hypothetical protein
MRSTIMNLDGGMLRRALIGIAQMVRGVKPITMGLPILAILITMGFVGLRRDS